MQVLLRNHNEKYIQMLKKTMRHNSFYVLIYNLLNSDGVKARITGVIPLWSFHFSSAWEDTVKILGERSLHFWAIRGVGCTEKKLWSVLYVLGFGITIFHLKKLAKGVAFTGIQKNLWDKWILESKCHINTVNTLFFLLIHPPVKKKKRHGY